MFAPNQRFHFCGSLLLIAVGQFESRRTAAVFQHRDALWMVARRRFLAE
jgi:hypothetical protein